MARPEDEDWVYLDRMIALALEVIWQANEIKEMSDDPDVLHRALKIEAAGLIIQKTSKDYRPRLRWLKEAVRAAWQGECLTEKEKGPRQ